MTFGEEECFAVRTAFVTGNATLRYGTGNTTDVSGKLGTIGAGTTFTVDTNGNICIYVYGKAHILIDANGWCAAARAGRRKAFQLGLQ
mgnify:CR=1 FL=1